MSKKRVGRRRIVAGTAVAGVLALALTACGSGNSTTKSDATPVGDSSAGSSAAVDAAKAVVAQATAPITDFPDVTPVDGVSSLAGKNVWFVPIGMAPPAFQVYADAITEALNDVKINVHVCDGKFVPTTIAACLDQAGSSGADAVVTGYVDYVLVKQSVDALTAKGVKVLLGGVALPDGVHNTDTLAFRDTNDEQRDGEQLTANDIIADSGGDANILYIGATDSPALKSIADETVSYIQEKCPDCTVDRIDYNTASLDKLQSLVSTSLIKDDSDYVFAELDTAIPSAQAGAQAAGKTVKIAGLGADLTTLQGIAAGGPEIATAGSHLAYASWVFANDVITMLTGKAPADTSSLPIPYRLFNADNVSGLDLTPKGYASMDWYGDDSYKDTFLSAWGVS